ncbi:MAG: RIP metalloprotease RseP [Pseudomonadales bacterium]
MDFLHSALAFVLTLGVLVTIHEWGHFYVARLCKVKVLRFSVGFGKVLYSRTDRSGTEFALAAIPLGGYVKMLDEREGPVDEHLKAQAFNQKTVWQRIAIVAAGPAVNLIFAVLAYWALFGLGVTTVIPVIGSTTDKGVAEVVQLPRGAEIISIDGRLTASWQDVNLALARRIGDTGALNIVIRGGEDRSAYSERQMALALHDWNLDLEKVSPVSALGIEPFRPVVVPVISTVVEGGRAQEAGLKTGDRVLSVDGEAIENWAELVVIIQGSAEHPLRFTVLRNGRSIALEVVPATRLTQQGEQGYIGAGVSAPQWPAAMLRTVELGLFDALWAGVAKTWQMISLTLDSIIKMIEGIISVKNLSGPITIAKVASASAASGLESYISFLAYLSISLGVLNLLPIPMLDGGHLLFYLLEAARGKPVPQSVQDAGLRLGMIVLFSLMAVAIFNDFMRL